MFLQGELYYFLTQLVIAHSLNLCCLWNQAVRCHPGKGIDFEKPNVPVLIENII